MPQNTTRFARYAWGVLVYDILIILWGAWVRITGSGAGCGDHWPGCDGQVIPRSFTAERAIEYTHRVTSGLSLPLAIVVVVWAWRLFPRWHRVVKASFVALFFLLVEAAIGALIVKRELVNEDASIHRAVVMAVHLVNTFTLIGAAALTAWWATARDMVRPATPRGSRLMVAGMALLLLTGMTGAVTALGDTLFPPDVHVAGGLFTRIADDLSPTMHFLIRLRIVHPAVAILTAIFFATVLVGLRGNRAHSPMLRKLAGWTLGLLAIQVLGGVVNIWLHAPGWMQIIHLLIADFLWVAAVLTWETTRPARLTE